jgi:hypothetical protein
MSKKSIYRVIFLLLSGVCGLFITEVGLRLFYPQALGVWYKTRDDLIILRPNFKGVARGVETVQEIQTNSFGMRDREHKIESDNGVMRIMLLGDSHMEALQMKFEKSFPKLLEDKLKDLLRREVEVLNTAVSGWGTDDQLTYFSRYGKKLKPNLVLLAMTLHNDISDNLNGKFHTFLDGKLVAKPAHEIPFLDYQMWRIRAFMNANLHFYQLFRYWWHHDGVEEGEVGLNNHVANLLRTESPVQIDRGWRMTEQLLVKLKSEAAEINADCAIFLIPLSMQMDEAKLEGFLSNSKLSAEDVDIEKPQEMAKSILAKERIGVIDLLPCFRAWESRYGKPLFLKYDGHWTEEGHELASTIVSQSLVKDAVMNPQISEESSIKAGREFTFAKCP